MERLGLGHEALRARFPCLVYAEVTGYGGIGPWRDKPGQDLLVQSLSGLAWLNGNADQPPMPFGLAVAEAFPEAWKRFEPFIQKCKQVGTGATFEYVLHERLCLTFP